MRRALRIAMGLAFLFLSATAGGSVECNGPVGNIRDVIDNFENDIRQKNNSALSVIPLEMEIKRRIGTSFRYECVELLLDNININNYLKLNGGVSIYYEGDLLKYGFFISGDGNIQRPFVKLK